MVGAIPGLLLSSWYHKRMLERRRAAKTYNAVPGDDVDEERDVELGDTGCAKEQENGVVATPASEPTVTEQLDTWDENAEEWDDDEPAAVEGANGASDVKSHE